jgi:hypothetical protein
MTQDVFETLSKITLPATKRRALWLPVQGNDYTSIRLINEYSDALHVIVESTPCRRPFKAKLSTECERSFQRMPKPMLDMLGYSREGGKIILDTFVDLPYMQMYHRLVRGDRDGGYQIAHSCLSISPTPIQNEESDIWSISMPNLFHNQQPLAFANYGMPHVCWGTALESFGHIGIEGTLQLSSLFFDAYFNKDLIDYNWFFHLLPLIANRVDSPLQTMSPTEIDDLFVMTGFGNYGRCFKNKVKVVLDCMARLEARSRG